MRPNLSQATLELPTELATATLRLRIRDGTERLTRLLSQGAEISIGTASNVDVRLKDATVSRLHCTLGLDETGLWIRDCGSKNGILVEGARVRELLVPSGLVKFSLGQVLVEVAPKTPDEKPDPWGLVGQSEPMKRLRSELRRIARLRAPVLVLGETGTGKDLVARALHHESEREGQLITQNAAALPEGLLDAEFFGHERGAFTGALGKRAGFFELADKGSLFLDEIADLSLSGQAKLLRVVEDGVVRPIGSGRPVAVDVRLISATCHPLRDRVEYGTFREDLFHRLSVLCVEVPPLRKRRTDVPLLSAWFFQRHREEFGIRTLDDSAQRLLSECDWPGNVRQLFSILYRVAAAEPASVLTARAFGPFTEAQARGRDTSRRSASQALKEHGSLSAAARALKLPRSTLRSRLARENSRAGPEAD